MTRVKPYTGNINPASPNPAKVTEWRGTVSGNFQTAGNWTNGAPGEGDTLIFNSGSVDVDAGLSNPALMIEYVYINHAYTGKIGTASSPLILDEIAIKFSMRKRYGSVHLRCRMKDVYIIETPGGENAVTLEALTSDWIDNCFVSGTHGEVEIIASSRIRELYVTSASRNGKQGVSSSRVTLGASVTDVGGLDKIPVIYVGEGAHLTAASGGAAFDVAGEATMTGAATSTALNVFGGGFVRDKSSGTLTALTMQEDGQLDLELNENAAKVITDLTTYPGSRTSLGTGLKAVTVTNGVTYWGGEFYPEPSNAAAV